MWRVGGVKVLDQVSSRPACAFREALQREDLSVREVTAVLAVFQSPALSVPGTC